MPTHPHPPTHPHAHQYSALLDAGAPWNALDRAGMCAGEYAVQSNHQEAVDLLVRAGVRYGGCAEGKQRQTGTLADWFLKLARTDLLSIWLELSVKT